MVDKFTDGPWVVANVRVEKVVVVNEKMLIKNANGFNDANVNVNGIRVNEREIVLRDVGNGFIWVEFENVFFACGIVDGVNVVCLSLFLNLDRDGFDDLGQ